MADIEKTDGVDKALTSIDEAKRATLKRMITGAVYVAPVVTSFAIDGMMVSSAKAVIDINSTFS
jgi:hypothetical protein